MAVNSEEVFIPHNIWCLSMQKLSQHTDSKAPCESMFVRDLKPAPPEENATPELKSFGLLKGIQLSGILSSEASSRALNGLHAK